MTKRKNFIFFRVVFAVHSHPVLKLLASQGKILYEGKNIMLKEPYHMKENYLNT